MDSVEYLQAFLSRPETRRSIWNTSMLAVRQIELWKDIEVFLRLPWSLYANDPNWVPPLLAELRNRFNPRKNPYFQHAQAALFLAERDGNPVGRITAQVCQLAQKHQRSGDGHFEPRNQTHPTARVPSTNQCQFRPLRPLLQVRKHRQHYVNTIDCTPWLGRDSKQSIFEQRSTEFG